MRQRAFELITAQVINEASRDDNSRVGWRRADRGGVCAGRINQHHAQCRQAGCDCHFLDDVGESQLLQVGLIWLASMQREKSPPPTPLCWKSRLITSHKKTDSAIPGRSITAAPRANACGSAGWC